MIQAPSVQYIPAPQQMPMSYPPQGAVSNIQYTPNAGYYYNYPAASCYAQPQTAKSQFNGVNIEIINPQGQGVVPQASYTTTTAVPMPAQFVPVQQPVYMPQPAPAQFPASQAIVQTPGYPDVVAQQPEAPVVPAPQIVTPQTTQAAPAAAPVVEAPAAVSINPQYSPASFAAKLTSDNVDTQKDSIEELAELIKNDKEAGPGLLDTQVFDALLQIINKDTSALEAPSDEVKALRSKPKEQLSEAEKIKAETPSPLEKAEINKQYAIYTIAFMQELLNKELTARNNPIVSLENLPCIEDVINAVKSNPNPIIRVSGIAALSHIARPEYKENLTTIFELAKSDEDERVKEAADNALGVLASV